MTDAQCIAIIAAIIRESADDPWDIDEAVDWARRYLREAVRALA